MSKKGNSALQISSGSASHQIHTTSAFPLTVNLSLYYDDEVPVEHANTHNLGIPSCPANVSRRSYHAIQGDPAATQITF